VGATQLKENVEKHSTSDSLSERLRQRQVPIAALAQFQQLERNRDIDNHRIQLRRLPPVGFANGAEIDPSIWSRVPTGRTKSTEVFVEIISSPFQLIIVLPQIISMVRLVVT
jgi:hypothetical protein